jgi:leucyl-tRNA synthetase
MAHAADGEIERVRVGDLGVMEERYPFHTIEPKWQQRWEEEEIFRVDEETDQPKFYLLEMLPYPSGRIHMGHVRNYSIGDVLARFLHMRGSNVLHPMGWDAFGLPAENAAIENRIHPAKWTYANIAEMKAQLKQMGFSYDWTREIASCDPEYYQWNQWIFLKMWERGLAYRKKSLVNWCNTDQTVLANEQVVEGLCWRCSTPVTQKELEQWFLRITAYADELLEGCERLAAGWPERVLTMQRNWIGRSAGVEVDFPIVDGSEAIRIFTTRQDTLYGATFVVLAPEHPLLRPLVAGVPQEAEVLAFVEQVSRLDRITRTAATTEKRGVFTGRYALNPLTMEPIPIWVANFVLMEYGTGAIMAVPAHDQRDFEFAKAYALPMRVVIQPPDCTLEVGTMTEGYTDEGTMVNSGPFSGLSSVEGREHIAEYLEKQLLGQRMINFRIKDWGISRQRYWGTPIPMIYCPRCGIVPVPYDQLPVVLPLELQFEYGARSPLAEAPSFYEVSCPRCQGPARRETDTMDTFVDSSWYFERYTSPHASDLPFELHAVDYWMPVDLYIGGIEHAVLHLLYARFWTKVLRDLGLLKVDEPFSRLLTQGMVCMETLWCEEHEWRFPEQVREGKCVECGHVVTIGRTEKMSKSKRNVIDPDAMIRKYGADTTRLFILFAAPPERDLDWNEQGVEGCYRFLNRVWRMVRRIVARTADLPPDPAQLSAVAGAALALRRKTHQTIRKVTEDIQERFHFNTAVAAIMELINMLYQVAVEDVRDDPTRQALREAAEATVLLLSPFTPHIAEALWMQLGHSGSTLHQPWPVYDPALTQEEEITVVVQINGRVRSRLTVPASTTEDALRDAALRHERTQEWIAGKSIRKVIVVPQKLVNIVVA